MFITILSKEEYRKQLKEDIAKNGFVNSIAKRLNDIDDIASKLTYLDHRLIQELCNEVLLLIGIEIEEENKTLETLLKKVKR